MLKESIDYEAFARCDIRIGTVVEVKAFPRARNPSYKVAVSFDALGTLWSSAQITNYAMDDLLGRQVVCVVNMPARNIAGFQSECLILGAHDDNGQVVLLQPQRAVVNGGAVS